MPDGPLNLLRAAWRAYVRDYARDHAAAIVYYALVALVPLLLLLLGALGLVLLLTDFGAELCKVVAQRDNPPAKRMTTLP
jgi:uncharacterized BrkB/YihY/UPF0761 family membrane protein